MRPEGPCDWSAQAFLRESSSFEGADPSAAKAASDAAGGLDPTAFLSHLSAILGTGTGGLDSGDGESSDESSDFYDDGDGDSSDAMSDGEAATGWPPPGTPCSLQRKHLNLSGEGLRKYGFDRLILFVNAILGIERG